VSRPVVIAEYNARWPTLYEEEKLRTLDVAGHRILEVEHIGSTAVVGLGAKPIIDIMAGVSEFSDADELLPLLREIGYEDVTRQAGDSEWYYCLGKIVNGKEGRLQSFHLHLMKFRSETWERHIVFRDFLRDHPEVAKRYNELKRILAAEHGVDRESYTNAKTKFITSVVTQAQMK
jgi:GrpB-like predicted nucleotidyltransferase (UPF0157 family)